MPDLKPLIGKCAAGQPLTREEARTAFDVLMSGEATPSEIGGFLMIPEDVPPEQRDMLYKFYGSVHTAAELFEKYCDLMEGIASLPFLAGFCYTQLTDIEQEINGLLTYNRQPKVAPEQIAELHQQILSVR